MTGLKKLANKIKIENIKESWMEVDSLYPSCIVQYCKDDSKNTIRLFTMQKRCNVWYWKAYYRFHFKFIIMKNSLVRFFRKLFRIKKQSLPFPLLGADFDGDNPPLFLNSEVNSNENRN